MLVHGGTRSLRYRQWPPGPPRERMRTRWWGQHPFPAQPFCVFICWDSEAMMQHDRYCSAGIAGSEAIMTTFSEPMGRRASGMRGDSISAPLHHHFTVQCRLMKGTWARLSGPRYAERAVWARSAAPNGLPLAGEDKEGVEPSVRIHTPTLLPFAPISFVFCTCFPPRSSATVHRHGH
jgi:hypothetical protein